MEACFGFQWVQTHRRRKAGQQPCAVNSCLLPFNPWYTEAEEQLRSHHNSRSGPLGQAAGGRSHLSCLSKASLQSQVLTTAGNNAKRAAIVSSFYYIKISCRVCGFFFLFFPFDDGNCLLFCDVLGTYTQRRAKTSN